MRKCSEMERDLGSFLMRINEDMFVKFCREDIVLRTSDRHKKKLMLMSRELWPLLTAMVDEHKDGGCKRRTVRSIVGHTSDGLGAGRKWKERR